MRDNIEGEHVTHTMTSWNIKSMQKLLINIIFIRPSFDGRIMLWRCPYVRPSVRT